MSLYEWKNKNGTKDRECKCGSWKQHWINFSNEKWPETCSVYGCKNKPELGAHVYEVEGNRKEYIIPACISCNNSSETFQLKSNVKKVSANTAETCE